MTLQNKPQLSAIEEMALKYNIPLADLESLLATALEEQRASLLAEVEIWSLDNEKSESPDIDCDDPDCECQQQDPVDYDKVIIRNELLAELRAKLVEMKEGK